MQLLLNLNKIKCIARLKQTSSDDDQRKNLYIVLQWRVATIEFAINCKWLRSCGTFTVHYIHHHHFPYKSTSLLLLHTIKLNSKPVFNVRVALERQQTATTTTTREEKEAKGVERLWNFIFGRTLRISENDFIAFLSKWVRISRVIITNSEWEQYSFFSSYTKTLISFHRASLYLSSVKFFAFNIYQFDIFSHEFFSVGRDQKIYSPGQVTTLNFLLLALSRSTLITMSENFFFGRQKSNNWLPL